MKQHLITTRLRNPDNRVYIYDPAIGEHSKAYPLEGDFHVRHAVTGLWIYRSSFCLARAGDIFHKKRCIGKLGVDAGVWCITTAPYVGGNKLTELFRNGNAIDFCDRDTFTQFDDFTIFGSTNWGDCIADIIGYRHQDKKELQAIFVNLQ